MNREWQWLQLKDADRAYSAVCPKGHYSICYALVAVAQAGDSSSILNPLCAKDQGNETRGHRSVIYQLSGRLLRRYFGMLFPLFFPLILQLLTLVSLPVCISLKRAFLLITDLGELCDKC